MIYLEAILPSSNAPFAACSKQRAWVCLEEGCLLEKHIASSISKDISTVIQLTAPQ